VSECGGGGVYRTCRETGKCFFVHPAVAKEQARGLLFASSAIFAASYVWETPDGERWRRSAALYPKRRPVSISGTTGVQKLFSCHCPLSDHSFELHGWLPMQ
ncbi:unnamed protein product, partial [Ectocarpus sp. 12 AP-2014]